MFSEIQSKINNAPSLDFGDIFNESIQLFKKSWLYGFLLQIFVMIITSPFIIIMYMPMFVAAMASVENGETFDPDSMDAFFAGMSVLYMIGFFVGILIIAVLSLALNAGLYKVIKKLDYNEEVKVGDLFYFFKGNYIGKLIVIMLVTMGISIVAAILCYLPLIYAMVPLSFFMVIFAFNPDLSVGDIVKLSFMLGNKKWLITFGLLVVSYIVLLILTIVTCGLGSLFLSAFMYHPIYLIYKKVVGFGVETVNNIEA
ncbi:hypothetical protein [Corallibacter sp.]|uniref:hypothetical protein n=1 Tax=Corallibacter sp. TaxID=2038084 RepID=UPI003AB24178